MVHRTQNQALEQTRDSVLRYGERVGCELLNFVVRREYDASLLHRSTCHIRTCDSRSGGHCGCVSGFMVVLGCLAIHLLGFYLRTAKLEPRQWLLGILGHACRFRHVGVVQAPWPCDFGWGDVRVLCLRS